MEVSLAWTSSMARSERGSPRADGHGAPAAPTSAPGRRCLPPRGPRGNASADQRTSSIASATRSGQSVSKGPLGGILSNPFLSMSLFMFRLVCRGSSWGYRGARRAGADPTLDKAGDCPGRESSPRQRCPQACRRRRPPLRRGGTTEVSTPEGHPRREGLGRGVTVARDRPRPPDRPPPRHAPVPRSPRRGGPGGRIGRPSG